MANYPLNRMSQNTNDYTPQTSFYSDECAERMCTLFLRDKIFDTGYGKTRHYYRLHAEQPHNIEQSLAYNIRCPKCSGWLKVVGRCLDSHTLGLYECPNCSK